MKILVIQWRWNDDTPHAGAKFWGAHSTDNDGRIRDWPSHGLTAIGAAEVEVEEGKGLELLAVAGAA